MIPGFQRAIDVLQDELDSLRSQLSGLQRERKPIRTEGRKPDWKENISQHTKSYWARFTPEQRSEEMRRRMALGKRRRARAAV